MITTELFETLKWSANNLITALLALPSLAGSFTRTKNPLPSLETSSVLELGTTLTLIFTDNLPP